jgi:hypothetical protein
MTSDLLHLNARTTTHKEQIVANRGGLVFMLFKVSGSLGGHCVLTGFVGGWHSRISEHSVQGNLMCQGSLSALVTGSFNLIKNG